MSEIHIIPIQTHLLYAYYTYSFPWSQVSIIQNNFLPSGKELNLASSHTFTPKLLSHFLTRKYSLILFNIKKTDLSHKKEQLFVFHIPQPICFCKHLNRSFM